MHSELRLRWTQGKSQNWLKHKRPRPPKPRPSGGSAEFWVKPILVEPLSDFHHCERFFFVYLDFLAKNNAEQDAWGPSEGHFSSTDVILDSKVHYLTVHILDLCRNVFCIVVSVYTHIKEYGSINRCWNFSLPYGIGICPKNYELVGLYFLYCIFILRLTN